MANFGIAWLKASLVAKRTPYDERNGENSKERHLPRDEQKYSTHHDDRGADLQEVVGPFVQEPFKLIDIVVENGEDVAFLSFVKPYHALLLNVVKRVQPQLVLHGLSEVAPQDAVEVLKQGFQPPDNERQG